MTIASFFSGIDGLSLGLEWAGLGPTVFQCESDPYAQKILEKHWPGVTRHDDITTLRPGDIPHADVWCGGFPCQDISVAGKGAGLDGDRSGLWYAWLDLIRVVRPRVLVVENVAALAARGLGVVLGQLSEAGYDAEWETFGAADVGAPHRRLRVFIIAYLADTLGDQLRVEPGRGIGSSRPSTPELGHDGSEGDVADDPLDVRGSGRPGGSDSGSPRQPEQPLQALVDSDQVGRDGRPRVLGSGRGAEPADGGDDVADTSGSGLPTPEQPREPGPEELGVQAWSAAPERGWWGAEPDVGRVAHGVPSRVDRLKCLGNAVVPQCAYVVGLRVEELMNGERNP